MASFLKKIQSFFRIENKETYNYQGRHYADATTILPDQNLLSVEDMLGLTYITKSIQMIARDVAKVKWIQKKIDTKNNKSYTVNSKLFWLLNRKPNDDCSAYNFKTLLVWNLFLYHKAAIFCQYEKFNDRYYLTNLIPIYPEYINKTYKNGFLQYEIIINNSTKETVCIDKEYIIWMEYAIINNVNNVSIQALFKSTFAKLRENEAAVINSIKNDTGVAMLINVPDITDKKTVTEVQDSINTMVRNQKKYGSIALVKDRRWSIEPNTNIIESKIDYTTRNSIAREVAAVFGIPASKLGIEDNNKYNTMVERNRAYTDDAVKPILDIICTALTDYFFPTDMTNEITYRSIDLLSLDPGALKDFASSAINNAFATPNEIRELIGWEALDEGDMLMANSAIVPIRLTIKEKEITLKNLKNNSNVNKTSNETANTNNIDNDKNTENNVKNTENNVDNDGDDINNNDTKKTNDNDTEKTNNTKKTNDTKKTKQKK